MVSRKEERKDEEAAAARQAEAPEIVNRTLDEAKDSTRRAMEAHRRDMHPDAVTS